MKKSMLSSVLVATTLLSSIPALNSGHVAHAGSMSPLTTKGKEIQKMEKILKLKVLMQVMYLQQKVGWEV